MTSDRWSAFPLYNFVKVDRKILGSVGAPLKLLPTRTQACRTPLIRSKAFSLRLRQSRQEGRRGHAVKTQAAFGAKAKTSDKVYLCIDCGYIYDGRVPFSELEKDYICPVCQAPKRRFKAQSKPASSSRASSRQGMPASGEGMDKSDTPALIAGGVGILVVVAAVYFYLSSQY
ncbi:hypothetical protein WJX75_001382 [Coccomyxa subellipsoidea]|uniref:Rubredoxin-like domain-containing protein n=1 Tax=Coccomyxa subellipsoidea TaxID=248742 RepID=A0ABR2YB97_9CHLO